MCGVYVCICIDICLVTLSFYVFSDCKCLTQKKRQKLKWV